LCVPEGGWWVLESRGGTVHDSQPLTTLTKKTQQWKWTTTEHTAFAIVKVAYTLNPILLVPDYEKAFEIAADALLLRDEWGLF